MCVCETRSCQSLCAPVTPGGSVWETDQCGSSSKNTICTKTGSGDNSWDICHVVGMCNGVLESLISWCWFWLCDSDNPGVQLYTL